MASAPKLTREQSMRARPIAVRILSREPLPYGGQRLTVGFQPTGFQKFLIRNTAGMTKKFELDPFGLAVLKMCDGTKSVRHITDAFAKKHKLHPAEAERAVSTFLQTMMRKGLIAMAVE
jgi:hypothetical protein